MVANPLKATFGYRRLKDPARPQDHFYQATATFKPAIIIPGACLKGGVPSKEYTKLTERLYKKVRHPMGDFISRFGKKSGVTAWHLILEERVINGVPGELRDAGIAHIAEEFRPFAVVVSASPVERSATSFKPFFFATLDEAVAASGILSDSALYLFIYTVSVRAYVK